jgi:cytochrome c553
MTGAPKRVFAEALMALVAVVRVDPYVSVDGCASWWCRSVIIGPLLDVRRHSMPTSTRQVVGFIVAMLIVPVMWPTEALAASIAAGRQLAENVCATCHVIGGEQPMDPILQPPAPAFAAIAARPGLSASDLRQMLSTRHWQGREDVLRMPDLILLERQQRDVAAYLLSLRPRRGDGP